MRVNALTPEVRHSPWTHSGLTVGSTSLNELTYQGSVEARAPRVGLQLDFTALLPAEILGC
jgi:hypothetical protein